jgi:TetR/AcrR family transcriptional regulator, cholesterol catabolism regulator
MSPRKIQILQQASALMRTKGYASTTVRDIANSLNIEASSLYNHISSKEEILETICASLANQFESGILEINDIYFNAKEKLKMAIESHIRILTQDLNASYVFIHEWRNLGENALNEFVRRRDLYEKEFRDILYLGEKEGTFTDVDEKFVVITILSSLNSTIEWYKPNGQLSPKDVSNKLSDFILNGLLNSQP